MDMPEPPSVIVSAYLPPDFRRKSVNESFIQKVMELALSLIFRIRTTTASLPSRN